MATEKLNPGQGAAKADKEFRPTAADFEFVDIYKLGRTDQVVGRPTKYAKEIVKRFFRNRWAFAFTILLGLILLTAIIVAIAPPYDPMMPIGGTGTAASYLPARPFAWMQPEVTMYGTINEMNEAVKNGTIVEGSQKLLGNGWVYEYVVRPYTSPGLEDKVSILGTDNSGDDIWTRLWLSVGVSIGVALAVAVCSTLIGIVYGAISGSFAGRWPDTLMMRIIDVIGGVPTIIWLIVLGIVFAGASTSGAVVTNSTLIPALIIISWMGPAASTRTYILKTKDADYIQATRTLGGGQMRVVFSHMVPVIMGRLAVIFVNMIPSAIFFESSLVFLGLKSTADLGLGLMLNNAWQVSDAAEIASPIVVFGLLTISAQIIANALNDAIDPRVVGRG